MSAYAYSEARSLRRPLSIFSPGLAGCQCLQRGLRPRRAPGSENAGEGVLTRYLVPKLRKLNFTGSADAIQMALIL